ncbi:DUF5710 domain-containing protein [Pseudomonas sp. WS 5086]|uniref:DUF5710 domain-containing protein n=1 Tax=Pseudomonas sp. WS 5086 TaxID=2717484 RepID=UPI0021CC8051|nr:DUF5710 domain-containing protein [Pseudomonas sp. WS 5086]
MARIDLKLTFSEKDEAKSLGARWDPSLKTWHQITVLLRHRVGVRLLGLLQFDPRALVQAARATRRI